MPGYVALGSDPETIKPSFLAGRVRCFAEYDITTDWWTYDCGWVVDNSIEREYRADFDGAMLQEVRGLHDQHHLTHNWGGKCWPQITVEGYWGPMTKWYVKCVA